MRKGKEGRKEKGDKEGRKEAGTKGRWKGNEGRKEG